MDNQNTQSIEVVAGAEEEAMSKSHEVSTCIGQDDLMQLGLSAADLDAISILAGKTDTKSPLAINKFGRDVSERTSQATDLILAEAQNSDLGDSGEKLSQIVVEAKRLGRSIHIGEQSWGARLSQMPVIGTVFNKVLSTRDKCVSQFQSSKTQIDALVQEVASTQHSLMNRVEALDGAFNSVQDDYRSLGIHVAAGKVCLKRMSNELTDLSAQPQTMLITQEISDLQMRTANLGKRIDDLAAIQMATLQTLPEIRIIQSANMALIDKYHTIIELTIPLWKRQFMMALCLNEQKNAVQLAQDIDDATNQFALQQAEQLRSNSIATAKANQRLVIDLSTLEKVNHTLIGTVEDIIKIQKEGSEARASMAPRLKNMKQDLQMRLIQPRIVEAAEQ